MMLQFPFLNQDQQIAQELRALLTDRYRVFIYTDIEHDFGGTDAEYSLTDVYGEKARCVVVLYRKGWGEARWTDIEQTAIRNRAHENGYDFVKFICLEKPPTSPKWLPTSHLFVDLLMSHEYTRHSGRIPHRRWREVALDAAR
jgi:hypothetical protein